MIPTCLCEGSYIRLLLAGQRDGILDRHLSVCPDIKLDTIGAHLQDIEEYAGSRTSDLRERFSLSYENQDQIKTRLVATSKGELIYSS